jgi:hypothetical protein
MFHRPVPRSSCQNRRRVSLLHSRILRQTSITRKSRLRKSVQLQAGELREELEQVVEWEVCS